MYLDPICTYTLTRLCPRFLKGLIWLSSKTAIHFLTLNSGTRYLACENFITSYIIIFYYCGICLLLEPRLVEVYRFYLQSWLHSLVLNVANKCSNRLLSKYITLRSFMLRFDTEGPNSWAWPGRFVMARTGY